MWWHRSGAVFLCMWLFSVTSHASLLSRNAVSVGPIDQTPPATDGLWNPLSSLVMCSTSSNIQIVAGTNTTVADAVNLTTTIAIVGSAQNQLVLYAGMYSTDVSTDSAAFVISSNCTSVSSLVASVLSTFNNANSTTLTLDSTGTPSGAYHVCMRLTPSNAYFDLGYLVQVGEMHVPHYHGQSS